MGKAADNEKLKFQATYYNNTAIGLNIAGVFAISYSGLQGIYKLGYITGYMESIENQEMKKEAEELSTVLVFSLIFLVVALLAREWCKSKAQKILSSIED